MENKEYSIQLQAKNDVASIANAFIGSKYRASIRELQITYLSILKIQQGDYKRVGEDGKQDGLYVSMRGAEINKALNLKGNNIYKQLDPVARSMVGRTIGVSDEVNESFKYVSIINMAEYKNSVLTIRFDNKMEDYILNLTANFTRLPKDIMLSFKQEYSFKLYELLKSKAYYPSNYKGIKDGKFSFTVSVAELQLTLGVVNSALDSVKKVLDNGNRPDYEKAIEKSPEKLYKEWRDFDKKVLKKSEVEINEKSDILVSHTTKGNAKGAHGKIETITFNIILKQYIKEEIIEDEVISESDIVDVVDVIELTEDEQFDFICDVRALTKFSKKDCETISIEAGWDMKKIEKAYEYMQNYSQNIDNQVGFLIKAIQEGYEAKSKKASKKKKIAGDFSEFRQTSYSDMDFDQMEKEILSNK